MKNKNSEISRINDELNDVYTIIHKCIKAIKICDSYFKDDRSKRGRHRPGRATVPEMKAVLGIPSVGKLPPGTTGTVDAQGNVTVYYMEKNKKTSKTMPSYQVDALLNIGFGVNSNGQFGSNQKINVNAMNVSALEKNSLLSGIANLGKAIITISTAIATMEMAVSNIKSGINPVKSKIKTVSEWLGKLTTALKDLKREAEKTARA